MSELPRGHRPGALAPAAPEKVAGLLENVPGAVVSRTLRQGANGSLTFFAFDDGQGLTEHTAPFDAYVQVVAGEVELRIGGQPVRAKAGEIVLMPANVPHALTAIGAFKMLLTLFR